MPNLGKELSVLALFGLWSCCPLTSLVALLAAPVGTRKLAEFQFTPGRLSREAFGDFSWEWALRGPLWFRSEGCQEKGLQEDLEQRRGSPQCQGLGVGLFPETSQPGKIQGLVEGLMGLQEPRDWNGSGCEWRGTVCMFLYSSLCGIHVHLCPVAGPVGRGVSGQ